MLERDRPDQLCYYQPGIGTMPPPGMWDRVKRWWVTRLDLAIAWLLLEEHVSDKSSCSGLAVARTRPEYLPRCSTRWGSWVKVMKTPPERARSSSRSNLNPEGGFLTNKIFP